MELTPRKRAIMDAVVKAYITTGEPIGSKLLCELLDMNVSSATLRNEMSDLCEMGLLNQPHTSAGRVPTLDGFKLYVHDLMSPEPLSPEIRLAIDSMLETIAHTPEQMPELGCQILADLTGLPSFGVTLSNESAKIKRIRMIPMGKHTLLLVVISTDGIAKSRIVLTDSTVNEQLLSLYSNICKVCIVGRRLSELNTAYLQSIVARVGDFSLPVMTLLSTIFEIIGEIYEPQLCFRGESKLISRNDGVKLSELVSQKDALISISSQLKTPVGVVFSDDFCHDLSGAAASIVVARYSTGGGNLGRIGVIGPSRVAYSTLIPSVEYFAGKLGQLMTKATKDMEE